MHTNRISPARKILVGLAAILALALLSGCETVTLTNLNANSMPENPSEIYTFSLRVTPRSKTVSSIAPHIIVDGKNFDMKRSPLGEGFYDFEYQLPPGREEVAYYFLVNFNVEGNGLVTPGEAYTDISRVKILRRQVLSIGAQRGPVGARISVVGRGFSPTDTILFNGSPAQTKFESPNAVSFIVPALEPGRNYQVALNGSGGNSSVGTFRIDPSTVEISPAALTLRTGERQMLNFTIQNPAPAGGLLLDVTTDVSDSVIMPEVVVQQGQRTATVTVEGGKPGTGSLFLKGFGAGEVTIPVTVIAR
jgi:hypothetical protein